MGDDDYDHPWVPPWLGVALMVAAIPMVLLLIADQVDKWGAVSVYALTVGVAVAVRLGGPWLSGRVLQWWDDRAERKELADG